jgi:predicted ABC-class ATPase
MRTNLLLVDEDTCATNFMIRDDKMIQLVSPDKEPITPFVRKVRSLYEEHHISSILVIGGSGDYFAVADSVVMMDCYKCVDVTARAKEIAGSDQERSIPFGCIKPRIPKCDQFKPEGKVNTRSKTTISYGDIELDISGVEQLVSKSQVSAIAHALQTISGFPSGPTLQETLLKLDEQIDRQGLAITAPGLYHGGLSRVRSIDIAAAMNRFRKGSAMKQK